MARTSHDLPEKTADNHQATRIEAPGSGPVEVPSADFVAQADIMRDGQDLVLESPDGSIVIIEGYFLADPAPLIVAPDGTALTPHLVESFVHHAGPLEYAQKGSLDDASPVGAVQEVTGKATVTRTDGTAETIAIGTAIYEGDVIETEESGAVNIVFRDDSTFAVSGNAKLAIDEYVFDPSTEGGESNFSMLRGMFVYTSGLIGKDDPDDVGISTPTGSIGIRGTIIAGNVDTGEYTVVEGAIVLRTVAGEEMTLSGQFETARFSGGGIENMGMIGAADLAGKFSSFSDVAPGFSSMLGDDPGGDSADGESGEGEGAAEGGSEETQGDAPVGAEAPVDEAPADEAPVEAPADAPAEASEALPPGEMMTDPAGDMTMDMADFSMDSGMDSFDSGDMFGGDDGMFGEAGSDQSLAAEMSMDVSGDSAGETIIFSADAGDAPAGEPAAEDMVQEPPVPPPPVAPPDPVLTVGGATVSFSENTLVSTLIHSVIASDPDGRTLSYSITAGNGGGEFFINAVTGQITLANALDYETTASYALTVQVDNGLIADTATITVNIGNVDDVAPVLNSNNGVILTDGLNEGGNIVLTAAMLDVSDIDTADGNVVFTVDVTPGAGILKLSGVPLVATDTFTLQDLLAGNVTYWHDGSEILTDNFDFSISDGVNAPIVGQLFNIDINAVNDRPVLNTAPSPALTTINEDNFAPAGDSVVNLVNGANSDAESGTVDAIAVTGIDNSNGTWEYFDGSWTAIPAVTTTSALLLAGADLIRFVPNTDFAGTATIMFKGWDMSAGAAYDTGVDTTAGTAFSTAIETAQITVTPDADVESDSGTFTGSAGIENITVSGDNNTVNLLDGDDIVLVTGTGNIVSGGLGDDTYDAGGGPGNNSFDGGTGTGDFYDGTAAASGLTFDVAAGTITDGSNTDTITNVELVDASLVATDDTLDFSGAGAAVDVDLSLNSINDDGAANAYSIANFENITGSGFGDALSGDAFDNIIAAGGGNDTIRGGFGGDDVISGDAGDDIFIADDADGDIDFDGGAGTDTYDASLRTMNMTVNLTTGFVNHGAWVDTIANVESFIGGSGDDTFIGDGTASSFTGGAGADSFMGGAGNDSFIGGLGTDTADYSAAAAGVQIDIGAGIFMDGDGGTDSLTSVEHVIGSSNNDILRGQTGSAEILEGGAGDDHLKGSGGTDTLDGGTGMDKADYSMFGFANALTVTLNSGGSTNITSAAGNDTLINIENITGTQGADTIDGSGDASVNVIDGWSGNDTLSGGSGDVLMGGIGSDTLVYSGGGGQAFNLSGGADADIIQVNGILNMTVNGNNQSISGGNSVGHIDVLEFLGSGGIDLNPDGVEDFLEGVELYDFRNAVFNTVNITLHNAMATMNDGGMLTIQVDDADVLNFDFNGLPGYTQTGAGASWVQFFDGTRTIRIESQTSLANVNVTGSATLSLNLLGGADGFWVKDDINERFGSSLASLGDRDGDGYDDLGIVKGDDASFNTGAAFTLSGQSAPIASDTLANMMSVEISADVALFNPGGADGMVISAVGDFDGDGVADYIVGSPVAQNGGLTSGDASIVSGFDGSVITELTGALMQTGDETGRTVTGIGDINGDGFADVLVGAPRSDAGFSDAGRAYIIFGSDAPVSVLDVQTMGQPQLEGSVALGATPVSAVATSNGVAAVIIDGAVNQIRLIDTNTGSTIMTLNDTDGAWSPPSSLDIEFMPGWPGGPLDPLLNAVDVMMKGPYLYILSDSVGGGGQGGITVLDLTNPANPVFVDYFTDVPLIGATSMEMVNPGQLVVTIDSGPQGGFVWLDVDPTADILGLHGTPMGAQLDLAGALDVAVNGAGNIAYVAGTSGLQRVDISGGNPVLMGSIVNVSNLTGVHYDSATNMVYAVANNGGNGTLYIYNAALGFQGSANNVGNLAGASDIAVQGDIAYITTATGVFAYDISNPASPLALGNIDTGGSQTTDDNAVALTIGEDGVLHVIGWNAGPAYHMTSYDIVPQGFAIGGSGAGSLLGSNAASAGDFNNDGFGDFLVSEPGTGMVHLVYGKNDGPGSLATDAYRFIGIATDPAKGIPVFGMGDMNGDGVSDIGVFESGYNAGEGRFHLIFGGPGFAAGSSGGIAAAADLSIASAGYEIVGGNAVGDFNGDGFGDAMIAMRDTGGAGDQVHLYVVYGGATLPAAYDITALNNAANAFHITYTIPAGANVNTFAFEISAAGDLDGDGYYDVAIGLPELDTDGGGASMDGGVAVLYGRETNVGVIVEDGDAGDFDAAVNGSVYASAASQSLVGNDAVNQLYDNGHGNVGFRAGAGNDRIFISRTDFRDIDGGGGYDVIETGGILDFRTVNAESMSRIEEIVIGGAGSVTLDLSNIFSLMESSDTGDLTIAGAGGTLNIDHAGSGQPNATQNQIAQLLGVDSYTPASVGGFYEFSFGSHTLKIADVLIDGGDVHIV